LIGSERQRRPQRATVRLSALFFIDWRWRGLLNTVSREIQLQGFLEMEPWCQESAGPDRTLWKWNHGVKRARAPTGLCGIGSKGDKNFCSLACLTLLSLSVSSPRDKTSQFPTRVSRFSPLHNHTGRKDHTPLYTTGRAT
jgi:hypothetical protein